MKKRTVVIGLVAIAAVILIVLYALLDPAKVQFFPRCPFMLLTGLKCPGCGITRMLLSLFRFDFQFALHYNCILLILLPFIVFFLSYWIYRYIRYGSWKSSLPIQIMSWMIVSILLVWGVVRNIIGM